MKIVHICPLYYPSIGGNQIHMQMLSEKLAELGEDVSIFTSNVTGASQLVEREPDQQLLPEEEIINGVRVRRFKINYWLALLIRRKLFKMRGGYRLLKMIFRESLEYWTHGPMVWGMLNEIRRQKPDIIMVTNNHAFTFYIGYWAKKLFKIPLVLMPITHFGDPWTSQAVLKKLYHYADYLIACTEFEKNYLVREGISEDKIGAHPIGIPITNDLHQDTKEIKSKYRIKEGPIVAYIGSMVSGKGIDVLIDSMKIIWQQYPQAQLLLAGKKTEDFSEIINKHLDQFTLEEKNRIYNIDYFSSEEKSGLFASVDVVSMASQIDAFGITYLDAWMQGKPVIGCRNMPQESIIDDGENGFLVEYGNTKELAESVKKLLSDEELRRKMGEKGRKKVSQVYNLDVYAENGTETLSFARLRKSLITSGISNLDDITQIR